MVSFTEAYRIWSHTLIFIFTFPSQDIFFFPSPCKQTVFHVTLISIFFTSTSSFQHFVTYSQFSFSQALPHCTSFVFLSVHVLSSCLYFLRYIMPIYWPPTISQLQIQIFCILISFYILSLYLLSGRPHVRLCLKKTVPENRAKRFLVQI